MSEVRLAGVSKEYAWTPVVRDLSLVVRDGEFVSLLGPSGCGKTTTLRLIAGFERPGGGEIRIGGEVVSSAASGRFVPPERRNIGMVFQSYALWPHMTVFENVAYPLRVRAGSTYFWRNALFPGRAIRKRVDELLKMVDLASFAHRYPAKLSGGQQQRVALARALATGPEILLLDEPFGNLDARLRESMQFELKRLQARLGITVICVTHDQGEAMAMSDRIAVMHRGMIHQFDTPRNLYEQPANEFVAGFIGQINLLPAEAKTRSGREGSAILDDGARQNTVQFSYAPSCYVAPPNVPVPPYHARGGPAAGRSGKVVLAIRPEQVRIGEGSAGIAGTVKERVFLGGRVEYFVRVGTLEVRVAGDPTLPEFAPGSGVKLEFRRVLAFPAGE